MDDVLTLVYDGECPFCSRYVASVRIRDAVGSLRLLDARQGGQEVEEIRSRGLIIDQGMVLIMDGQYYHGDDCLNRLAMMSTRSGFFNRFNYWLFRSPALSRFSYPILRAGRNAVLWVLGKKKLGY